MPVSLGYTGGMDTEGRPIIFSAPMVRAILDGRKTQTRRVLRLRPPYVMEELDDGTPWPYATTWAEGDDGTPWMPCHYGGPGDKLWVRETWGQPDSRHEEWSYSRGPTNAALPVLYRADKPTHGADDEYWRPSIHMPRWASRITLKVKEVRVERLQDITVEDIEAEGLKPFPTARPCQSRRKFRTTWDDINEKRSGCGWASNPWVWSVTFERDNG